MDQTQDSTRKTKPRSGCFLGCFGFSGKVVSEKKPPDSGVNVNPGNRKKARWFSWSRLKKSDAKTVPVDAALSEKAKRSKQIPAAEKKITSKSHSPATGQAPAAVPDQTLHGKPQKFQTRHETVKNIILEARNNSDGVGSSSNATCQKRLSFNQKTGGSHPGSPEKRSKTGRTTTVLSHSVSLPAPKRNKQATAEAAGNSHGHGEKLPSESDTLVGKFDPVVGLSIITVTLIIMLVWGRLCAILCTSAWFYFIPRLRTTTGSSVGIQNGSNRVESDSNYEECKKKVVLEGFLERNHRNTTGNL